MTEQSICYYSIGIVLFYAAWWWSWRGADKYIERVEADKEATVLKFPKITEGPFSWLGFGIYLIVRCLKSKTSKEHEDES